LCGIVGIWNLNGKNIDQGVLDEFTDSLRHRGPDGRGTFIDANVNMGLGHRRLSILDLSEAGSQPMNYLEGRYSITYNGEIYNFIELKNDLIEFGYEFRTETDTEVILAAYDFWGQDCQFKFNGMWAFVIWDNVHKQLFLSRDRFGIKPLHYTHTPGKLFAFASELKAFKSLNDFNYQLSEKGLRAVLTDVFSLEGTKKTLVKNVNRLQGGHSAFFSPEKGLKINRWWKTFEHLVPVPDSLEEQSEEFKRLFDSSCRLRMRSDVPIATALSGGIDSSSVLCTLSALKDKELDKRISKDWRNAFVASFPNSKYDEKEFAKITLKKLGIKGHFIDINPSKTIKSLQKVLNDFEEVYLSVPDSVSSIYREIRNKGFKISIDGHGVDEMLGGYPNFTINAIDDSLGMFGPTKRTYELIRTYEKLFLDSNQSSTTFTKKDLYSTTIINRYPWRLFYRLASKIKNKFTFGSKMLNTENLNFKWLKKPLELPTSETPEEKRFLKKKGSLESQLYRSFHFTILPTILRNFDRMSMANGVEIRTPFMDWRLVCYVFSLPPESKIGRGYTKLILRNAMRGRVPGRVLRNKVKIGLNSPLDEWFVNEFRPILEKIVEDPDFVNSKIWDGKVISKMINEKLKTNKWTLEESSWLWPFLHAYWYQRNCSDKYDFSFT